MHHFDIVSMLTGGVALGILAHAAHTIPQPTNVWARWIVGVIQYALANYAEGKTALTPPPETKP